MDLDHLDDVIGRSPGYIREILALPSRRTSRHTFSESMNNIMNGARSLRDNGIAVNPIEILRDAERAVFAFNTLRQRIQVMKFPQDSNELYPYLFLPIHEVSDQLGVSVELLNGRCQGDGHFWPIGSTEEHLLLAVQYTSLFQQVSKRSVRVPRNSPFPEVRQLVPGANLVGSELHVDVDGRRFGPLETELHWNAVIQHNYNQHRINLLLVNPNFVDAAAVPGQ